MHPSHLASNFDCKHSGEEGYPREELVAELGAIFLCADRGTALEDRADHAYIGS